MKHRRDILPFFYKGKPGARAAALQVDRRTLAFFGVVLVLIALASALYLRQASEVAVYAHEIRLLEDQREMLHRELAVQRSQVAVLGSLKRVLAEGQRLGYALPEAGDAQRRLQVQYSLAPAPTATPSVTAESPRLWQTQSARAEGLLQQLVAQLQEWLQAPP